MQPALLGLSLAVLTVAANAQSADGDARPPAEDPRVMLDFAQFDPLTATPAVPDALRAGADVRLFIVQFASTPTDHDRAAVRARGGVVKGYLPHDCHLVLLPNGAQSLEGLAEVRWVGAYEPAYRLEPFLLREHAAGRPVPKRKYNMVMTDKRRDKQALANAIAALGGRVVDQHIGGLLFTAELTGAQLLQAARLDEVAWIDRWGPNGRDMNNARAQGGANFLESVAGYTGDGVRGHVFEGVESDHSCFDTDLFNVLSGGETDRHGHCTAAIIFGNGANSASARGLAPDAIGFYTNYDTMTSSRNATIAALINSYSCMFTTASWGGALTGSYTSVSSDADDIVFDHRMPWTQSMSNWGSNTQVRPEAWAKNVISVGAVWHGNNSAVGDDSWDWPGPGVAPSPNASIGPAADTRNKPDLCAYYDNIWTSDLTAGTPNYAGAVAPDLGGYATPGLNTNFGGTSGATPIVAGFNALAIQMYTDLVFNHEPRVPGGSRFANRPYAQTLKALQIAGARPYTPTATNNRREHVGWGFPNVGDLYTRRGRISVIPEDVPIEQGETFEYEFDVLPGETTLKFVMTYLDPPANPAAAFDRVNDLNMRVISPSGVSFWGNRGLDGAGQDNTSLAGGSSDARDTVEVVMPGAIETGRWRVAISAPTVTTDAHLDTVATDATFALVVNGGRRVYGAGCARYLPDHSATYSTGNYYPFGGYDPETVQTTFAGGSGGVNGGTIYFDVTVNQSIYLHGLSLHTSQPVDAELHCDVYHTAAGVSHAGNETNAALWQPKTAGRGVSAGSGQPSHIEFAEPIRLLPGTYGFAIDAMDFNHRYTASGSTATYSDLNVEVFAGSASSVAFTGQIYQPRVANLRLEYRLESALASNMRYQTILRRDQLGPAGLITDLAFSALDTGRHWNRNITVRMSHVPLEHTMSATFANNLPSPVTVLDASNYSFRYHKDAWAEIGLQNGFAYDGQSDVVVDLLLRGNVQTTTGNTGGLFHRSSNVPRVFGPSWNPGPPSSGTVDDSGLRLRATFDCARAGEYGASCGRLDATHLGEGSRGDDFFFFVTDGLPSTFAFLALGFNELTAAPFPLDGIGWTNCDAFSITEVIETTTTLGSGTAFYILPIPDVPALDGTPLYGQWFQLDASEPGDLTFSQMTKLRIGMRE